MGFSSNIPPPRTDYSLKEIKQMVDQFTKEAIKYIGTDKGQFFWNLAKKAQVELDNRLGPILDMANKARLRGLAGPAATGIPLAAEAGAKVGQVLNRTPLLTDPKTTYGDFYTNLFREKMLRNNANTPRP